MSSCLDSGAQDGDASRIALAASLQALFVVASRVAASSPGSPRDDLLKSVAAVLPACLSDGVRRAGDTAALLDFLHIPDAAGFLDRGWALAIGECRGRLTSPSLGVAEWLWQLRVKPTLVALQRNPQDRAEEGPLVREVDLVFPIGHREGFGAAPICLAEELHRAGGQLVAWNRLVAGASQLPPLAGLADLTTWLWHFDSFFQEFLQGVPAYREGLQDRGQPSQPTHDTLYDQSRLAGAIAAGLARHAATAGPPLLLISGEMDSIQNYILGTRASADVDIADLTMRGRSSFLRLVVEIAAYRVCDNLRLPPGSVVMSAASKFIVLAPNTVGCRDAIGALEILFDRWALTELAGQTALSMAVTSCAEAQLESRLLTPHSGLQGVLVKLARRAQESRLRRFGLCEDSARRRHTGPAWDPPVYLDTRPTTDVADFQAHLARALVADNPRAVLHAASPHRRDPRAHSMPIMGFDVAITSSRATQLESSTPMQWDLRSWFGSAEASSWRGRCRKPLAVYSARSSVHHAGSEPAGLRQVLKGDIDHLSTAFQSRMPSPNLSRFAILSRELEGFFSTTVPGQLAAQFRDLVTILSGGDDFIYLGPAAEIMEFSLWLQAAFADHTNGTLTLSAGVSLPFVDGASVADAVEEADDALELAKQKRNCVGFADSSWSWPEWRACASSARALQSLIEQGLLSKRAAAEIGELLAGPSTSAYQSVRLESLLRAEAERYGETCGGDPSGSRARKADAFLRLKMLLLQSPDSQRPEQVLVPLTLAYTSL